MSNFIQSSSSDLMEQLEESLLILKHSQQTVVILVNTLKEHYELDERSIIQTFNEEIAVIEYEIQRLKKIINRL
jgi:hypothetical protein